MAPMELATTRLDREEFSSTTKPHLLRDAARHLLLGDRHADALATLRSAATEYLAASTGLLTGSEAVRALSAFIMRLVRTLHGLSPAFAERDRYAIGTGVSRTLVWSSIADEFALRSQTRICYLRQSFSCGQLVKGGTGDGLEVAVDNFWNGCSLSVVRRSLTS